MRPIDADAIEKIIRKRVYAIEVDDILADIANAPTIDAVSEWVPCEERLPIEGETVLLGDSCGNFIVGRLIRTDYNYKWDIPFFTAWMDFGCWDAWMPLPAPYKEDKDDA